MNKYCFVFKLIVILKLVVVDCNLVLMCNEFCLISKGGTMSWF